MRIDFKECYFISTSVISFPTLCAMSYFYASEGLTMRLLFIPSSVKSDNFVRVGEILALGISQFQLTIVSCIYICTITLK